MWFIGEFNSDPRNGSTVDMQLFSYTMDHLNRLCRILSQPKGHLVLVGPNGSGKHSMVKLCAYVCQG